MELGFVFPILLFYTPLKEVLSQIIVRFIKYAPKPIAESIRCQFLRRRTFVIR